MINITEIPDSLVYNLCIETTKILIEQQEKLSLIKWTEGESNIDTEYSKLACECCNIAWNLIRTTNQEYNQINIICNIPDINITFILPNNIKVNKKIELKSSKSLKLPGSTINTLDINQPLIYCLRPKNNITKYKIKCSQYHLAIKNSDIELFQDRTPRPFIHFDSMTDIDNVLPFEIKNKNEWIEHYAKCALNRINNTNCKNSWQDELVKVLKKYIIKDYLNNTSIEQIIFDKKNLQL